MGMMSNLVMSLFFRIHSAISSPLVETVWRCFKSKLETNTSIRKSEFELETFPKNPLNLRHFDMKIASVVFFSKSSKFLLSELTARL